MTLDLVDVLVEAVPSENRRSTSAVGTRSQLTFDADPGVVRALADAIETTGGSVRLGVAAPRERHGRLTIDADAMALPRYTVPKGHWFG